MELVVDQQFKETYARYFSGLKGTAVLNTINVMFSQFELDLITDTINIIKTSATCGFSYSECYDKIIAKILTRFPIEHDIDKFVISLVVKVMVASGSESIEELVKSPRNIYREVTAKHFRVSSKRVTQDMINEVVKAAKKFDKISYSVTDPPMETWDEYFYNVARQVARNSKCLSRRVGCVMVRDKSIISTGYNGPPRGIPRCDMRWAIDDSFNKKYDIETPTSETEGRCPRYVIGFKSGQGLDICPAGHAERNTLINAARSGIKTKGTTLYMSCDIPCSPCLVEIINAGVKEIVCTSLHTYDDTAMYLITNSDLGIRLFDFIK
jgi:dCMP deaminase